MNLLEEVQQKLEVGKNKKNGHGNFMYRTLGDINAAVKPIIKGKGTLLYSDDVIMIGDRHYIKAVCRLTESDGTIHEATSYARENSRKGMDDAQMTGACSSYARKYAAQGLFAIDEGENDPDGMPEHEPKPTAKPTLTQVQLDKIIEKIAGGEKDLLTKCQKAFTLTKEQHELILNTELNHTK